MASGLIYILLMWDAEHLYTRTWMANHIFHDFRFRQCHLVAQVTFWAEVAFRADVPLVLAEVRRFLWASSISADFLLWHFGMEGSHPYDLYKPLPGVFVSQPSPFYTQETQLLASSLLGLWRDGS